MQQPLTSSFQGRHTVLAAAVGLAIGVSGMVFAGGA
jgi:hypothetical protein